MKKAVIIVALGLFFGNLMSQTVPTPEELERFYSTKTLVVLDNNPMNEFNYIVKDVLKQEWSITDYEFITESEMEEKRLDPQYSFFYTRDISFERDDTDAKYKFMFVSLGGDYNRENQMPDIAAVPLSFANVDADSYTYKLAILVRFLHNHILKLQDNPDLLGNNAFKGYNDNMDQVKTKTLYVIESELAKEVNSLKRIKQNYSHDVRIVTKEEITEAIEEKKEDVVFLHKVGPEGTKLNARCYKFIVGANDAQLYYFSMHKISSRNPDGILAKDFKQLDK